MALILALVSSLLLAASLRLRGVVSYVLATYLAFGCNIGVVTWVLSPPHWVTPTGLLVSEGVAVLAAAAIWLARGRDLPDLSTLRGTLRLVGSQRLVAAFALVAGAALSYELVLALTAPPGNWDSLTYHLGRVLSWRQRAGIEWIPNAPSARMNEFQPFAEQSILFWLVATGSTSVFALPQFTAELAALVAVYGTARRIGFDIPRALCGTALLSTLSLVALEATTEQNDLVAASFAIVAAYFLLGKTPIQPVLAGISIALGIGTKLTVVLVIPVIAMLAWSGGRSTVQRFAAGTGLGMVLVGAWSFILNIRHTGDILGTGEGRVEHAGAPTVTGVVRTVGHVFYRLIDISALDRWWVGGVTLVGVAITLVAARRRQDDGGHGLAYAATRTLPFLCPAIVLGLSTLDAFGDPANVDSSVNNDFAAFGPVGMVALIAAPILVTRRTHRTRYRIILAAGLPTFVILLALYASYNIWITRFLVVPVVLTAPLFSVLFRDRLSTAAWLCVAALTVTLTLTQDETKPLRGKSGRPWSLTQAGVLAEWPARPTGERVAVTLTAYNRAVPTDACVGAVLDPDDFSSFLWGPLLRRDVFFLSSTTAPVEAAQAGLEYVVISNGANAPVTTLFENAGWKIEPLGTWWFLATDPSSGQRCSTKPGT